MRTRSIMNRVMDNRAGRLLVGTLVYLAGAYGAFNMATGELNPIRYIKGNCHPRETRIGEYQGFKVEAFKEGSFRRVIIFPEGRPERVIGSDYFPDREGFELVETMFLPESNPLRQFATPEHIQTAWDNLWGKDK